MDNTSDKIYRTAKGLIGQDASPKDKAPDDYACAESVNAVVEKATGRAVGGGVSTYLMDQAIRADVKRFTRLAKPKPGCLIMSATPGDRSVIGHVGIVGRNKSPDGTVYVMSNNSITGKWDTYFTIAKWLNYYRNTLGLEVTFWEVNY